MTLIQPQVSAGGVAFRQHQGQIEVALISVGETRRWQLPKGMINTDETPEAAAQREVREEAGIDTELIAPLERIEYWYFAGKGPQRTRFHKFVHFYLMRYRSGDPANHDHEVNEARWVEISRALSLLAFDGERRVTSRAHEMLHNEYSLSGAG
ncbi:MAG: NUDIX hydrolase [Anaerolineaceae bacterium]|nr:NUDIX hydrolase [Anaerolineaceae bacterium]